MPIRPERKALYPANWKSEIVPMIKARSGNRCEVCKVQNGRQIQRERKLRSYVYCLHGNDETGFFYDEDSGIHLIVEGGVLHNWSKPIKIILTTAHLNHDETDNRPENLAHLCQLHHNRHDAQHRAETRRQKFVKTTKTLAV